jgi:hypothetical protein
MERRKTPWYSDTTNLAIGHEADRSSTTNGMTGMVELKFRLQSGFSQLVIKQTKNL